MIKEQLLSKRYHFKEDCVPLELTPGQSYARELFFEEIHKKNKYIRIDQCPYCGYGDLIKISEVSKDGIPSDIVICGSCDGCFKSKILDPQANKFFYEKLSYLLRGKDTSYGAVDSIFNERIRLFAYPRYRFISHFITLSPGKDVIMELGCNDGANLVPWKQNGHDVVGIDLDAKMIEFGKGRGLNLVSSDILNYDPIGFKPKLIILSHVLGNVADLHAVLRRARDILLPDGYIFIEAPCIRSWQLINPLKFFYAESNYYFDLKSIIVVLKKNKLNLIYSDEFMRILCAPQQKHAALKNKQIKPALGCRVKLFLLNKSIASINLFNKKLFVLLSRGEKRSIAIGILNKLYKLYFQALYKSFERN